MDYEKVLSIKSDPSKILHEAKMVLMQNNFAVSLKDNALFLIGPGYSSTHQNPLWGISKGELLIRDDQLLFKAELNGVKNLQYFVSIFPFALGGFMSLLFLLIMQDVWAFVVPLLAVSPWLVISPIMNRIIQTKTVDAIERLLSNLNQ